MNSQESKKLEDRVMDSLKERLCRNSKVILAVSGGPDSVFLLHFLIKLQERLPFKIIVAHINHMIRGADSFADQKLVEKMAIESKNIFELKKVDVPKLSKKLKLGLEETGRKVRYEFFKNLAKRHKASIIITAHHADDNLETIILNFSRGGSLEGLSGMQRFENDIFRPILDFSKKEILDYLKFKKIPFRIDKTNKDTAYKRNFIRHKIIPLLTTLNPNLAYSVAKNSENIREISSYMKEEARNWLKKNSISSTRIEANSFRKLPLALQKIVLLEKYKVLIGSTKDVERKHIDEVLKIINTNVGNKRKKIVMMEIYLKNNIIHLEKISKKVHYRA